MLKKNIISAIIGYIYILIGIIFNLWTLSKIFAIDGSITLTQYKVLIYVFDLVCISIGILIIKFRPTISRIIAITIIVVLLSFLSAETAVRIFLIIRNSGENTPALIKLSKSLGWENVAITKKISYFLKSYGDIIYSTDKNGFRTFGNVDTRKTKIFVIGDSWTQAPCVSNGETYYDNLKKNTDIEIFAYGCSGYGSLQEYIILDKYLEYIKPDIILWQFCLTDLSDNCLDFMTSSNRVTFSARPYLISGNIIMMYPHKKSIARFVQNYSFLLRSLYFNLFIKKIILLNNGKKTVYQKKKKIYDKAVSITSEIMALVKRRAGKIPIVAFSVDSDIPFIDICRKNKIQYISNINNAVKKLQKSGKIVDGYPYDVHWNATGHSTVSKKILADLIQKKLL